MCFSEIIGYFCQEIHNILGLFMRQADVYVNRIKAGQLRETAPDHYEFDYSEEYRNSPESQAVCLAMPLECSHYESSFLFPFFSNLLSEGENRKFQSVLLKIDENDDFGLLLETAGYDTIGCVTVKPSSL